MLNNHTRNPGKTLTLIILLAFFGLTLLDHALFAQVRKQPIKQDWFLQDPRVDSVGGISLDKAYALLKGKVSKTIIVAVIDNGVDIAHEDLKNIIWTNAKEIPGNGIDDDHNGYIDDVHGWNFRGSKDGTIIENEQAGATQLYMAWRKKFENVDSNLLSLREKKNLKLYLRARKEYQEKLDSKDSTERSFSYNINFNSAFFIANDSTTENNHYYGSPYYKLSKNLSHGTHVAGIIAAQRNNGIGIDGIANNVRIMPIVATTAVGDERDKDIANAIYYAVNNGARIINMSFSKIFSPGKKNG